MKLSQVASNAFFDSLPSLANIARVICAQKLNLACDVSGYLVFKKSLAKRKFENMLEEDSEEFEVDQLFSKVSQLKKRTTFKKHSRLATNILNQPKTLQGYLWIWVRECLT